MRPFFEKDSKDESGEFLVPMIQAFNKVGHAIHDLHPVFESFSYSQVVKTICKEILQYEKPQIAQSMYMFKNPFKGAEISRHKDSTFMATDPLSACGIWTSLDAATVENGCMFGVPGSHK
jgi:phytanoyl-CoA hydroxylase